MKHRNAWFLRTAILLAVLLWGSSSQTVSAQEEKYDKQDVNFSTSDNVELQGVLYKTKKPGPQPCIILLHSPTVAGNKGSAHGDWDGLAKTLAGDFNVLRFDFRGHGKSDLIKSKTDFWGNLVNQKFFPREARKQPQPESLKSVDYIQKNNNYHPYLPMLVNDIMAARIFLDAKNDAGDLNTSTIYLIGAGDAASLGFLYLLAEWDRPQVAQPGVNISRLPLSRVDLFNIKGRPEWAGKDIAGAIWLSAEYPEGYMNTTFFQNVVKLKTDLRDSNKMLFLYGADDNTRTGKKGSDGFFNKVLVAEGNRALRVDPIRMTKMIAIPKTKLSGVDLLGKDIGTEKEIVKYLKDMETDRKVVARITRNYTTTPYVDPVQYGVIK